jgi:hypothetical protein
MTDTVEKSKIEELRKSREGRLFDVFVAARPVGSIWQPMVDLVRNDVVPLRRRVQNAPADLKNFSVSQKRLFQHYRHVCDMLADPKRVCAAGKALSAGRSILANRSLPLMPKRRMM